MRNLAVLGLLVLALGCEPTPPAPPSEKAMVPPPPPPAPPPGPAQAEPDRIVVQHILISFAGTRTTATRENAEAEKLASETRERLKKGEDFDKVVKELSDDPGPGIYGMANHGKNPASPGEYPRKGMVPAFGNVGFKLAVGE